MASLSEIRTGIARTIDNHTDIELFTYDQVEDLGNLPAVIVEPITADFEGAFDRGLDEWDFNLYVLVGRADVTSGQDILDALVSGSGPNSIRRILHEHSDLGLVTDSTVDAQCYAMRGYGGKFEWYDVPHIGAILRVLVRTDGKA